MKLYQFLRQSIDRVDKMAAWLACLMLFSLMLLVMADVSLRYLFNAPITWSYEAISLFLLPGVFFFSVGYTQGTHGHVGVDILTNYLGQRSRYVCEAITSSIAASVFAFIAWAAASQTFKDYLSGTYLTSGLEIPTWATSFMLPLGFGLLALRCLLNAVGYLASLVDDEPWLALPPLSGAEGGES